MTTTLHLGINEMVAAQAQKEVTFNDLLWLLDAVMGHGAINRTTTTPPDPSLFEGSLWIVATGATGDWLGKTNQLAQVVNGAWRFYAPKSGWSMWIDAESNYVIYDGVKWGAPDQVVFGTETDTFSQVVAIQRNGVDVGWLDNSNTNMRVKSASGNDARLINSSNDGFTATNGGHHLVSVLSAAAVTGDLDDSSISFSIDETGGNLIIATKDSAGTFKTATIAIT